MGVVYETIQDGVGAGFVGPRFLKESAHVQGLRQRSQYGNRHVLFAPFNTADIGASIAPARTTKKCSPSSGTGLPDERTNGPALTRNGEIAFDQCNFSRDSICPRDCT